MSETCDACHNEPYLFDVFRKKFIETEMWVDASKVIRINHEFEDINRLLRKRLYREFAMWNGTMTKPRSKHPDCVEKCVNALYSSKHYMGFKRTRNEAENTAVDIYGNNVQGVKWARKEYVNYETEVDNTSDS